MFSYSFTVQLDMSQIIQLGSIQFDLYNGFNNRHCHKVALAQYIHSRCKFNMYEHEKHERTSIPNEEASITGLHLKRNQT